MKNKDDENDKDLMVFNEDFLKTLGAWQKGWKENQSTRLELAKKIQKSALHLPDEFRKVREPCYRKRFLHYGELFDIIMIDKKEEFLTSWTIFPKYAENFKGLYRPDSVSAAIFEHTPEADEVILNVCELWRCKSFIRAAEEYRQNGGENCEAIFHFKASQGEVILNAPLRGSEIVALTGASSPFDELCDKVNIPESERDSYFKQLIDLGQYPEILKYTSKEGAQRVIQNTIKLMKEKIETAQSASGDRVK